MNLSQPAVLLKIYFLMSKRLLLLHDFQSNAKIPLKQFTKGGRMDLVAEESAQLAVLAKYLPLLMNKNEVEKIAKMKKDELGITDGTKKGMLMSALMKDLRGKADGMVVKEVVDSLLN